MSKNLHIMLSLAFLATITAGSLVTPTGVEAGANDNACATIAGAQKIYLSYYTPAQKIYLGGKLSGSTPTLYACRVNDDGTTSTSVVRDSEDGPYIRLTNSWGLKKDTYWCASGGRDRIYLAAEGHCGLQSIGLDGHKLYVSALGGDDRVIGPAYPDGTVRTYGNDGNDYLAQYYPAVGSGYVYQYGGKGNDTMGTDTFSTYHSRIYGNDGNDSLSTGDYCNGGSGSDSCACYSETSCP